MRSILRTLTVGLLATTAAAALAQYPYTFHPSGIVFNCYPGQVVHLESAPGVDPYVSVDIPLNVNCSWQTYLGFNSSNVQVTVSTWCQGMVTTAIAGATFNNIGDTVGTPLILLDCGGQLYDCNGLLNGPNMPGTACDDGNPLTANDTWSFDCICTGADTTGTYDCLQIWNGPNMPGTPCVTFFGDSGVWSIQCVCVTNSNNYDCLGILNGPNEPGTDCIVQGTNIEGTWSANCICVPDSNGFLYDCLGILNGPNQPGTPCDDGNPLTANDTWSFDCICSGADSTGTYDCLQIWNGPNMPGTPCVNLLGDTGTWSFQCICEANSNNFDCLGILNGPNVPGTDCIVQGTNIEGTWSANCICVPDSNGFLYDCLGILNGPNQPGTPCDDGNPMTTNDTWSWNCVCTGGNTDPCQADFWVLQAYGQDSLPIPYELWVWNLSYGGTGVYQYLWDFGDGESSTDAYPTHVYDGNGPYNLCLTINDANGCTSTHCDSISINQDGIYTGVMGGGGDRQDGFTINVQQQVGMADVQVTGSIATWPNPAVDELNIAVVSDLTGAVDVTVTDLNGRLMLSERATFRGGRDQLRIATGTLAEGLYVVRIGNGTGTLSQRFVKTY